MLMWILDNIGSCDHVPKKNTIRNNASTWQVETELSLRPSQWNVPRRPNLSSVPQATQRAAQARQTMLGMGDVNGL